MTEVGQGSYAHRELATSADTTDGSDTGEPSLPLGTITEVRGELIKESLTINRWRMDRTVGANASNNKKQIGVANV